jgi:hypothetical protein
MSDDLATDTSEDPQADEVTESLSEFIDQLLDALEEADADAEQLADLADARETLTTAMSTQERAAAGPPLAERIDELEAEIEERTIQKTVIRRVLAAHCLSDDHIQYSSEFNSQSHRPIARQRSVRGAVLRR